MYTLFTPKASTSMASETRPRYRRRRSIDEGESFEDLAPVLCFSAAGSTGDISKLGNAVCGSGSVRFDDELGSDGGDGPGF